ncbi:basic leucine zipper 4-like [Juglans regia]|uniref:Basic leucine zipper 4-like n=1 Tax=Juglans regia TaxID=51240 RepID=A0A2I4E9G9_JUGRE|nr:basic leucine zipper 4-like [Juglans regia]
MFFSQEPVVSQCPGSQEIEFGTDEFQEILSSFQSPTQYCNESLDDQLLSQLFQSRDSVDPNSGSEGSNRAVYTYEERQLRRKESNRKSARLCRWRKKRHLQNLTYEANRLKMENQELKNGLGLVLHQSHVIWADNQRLRSESIDLSARLSDLYQILCTMQSP